MTKQLYLDMCRDLGTEPVEAEIPIEYEDLPGEIQEALEIYIRLQDSWDTFNGTYQGKILTGIVGILDIFRVADKDKQVVLDWIIAIDRVRADCIANTQKTS